MAFWVLENIIYDGAWIHRAECPQCKDGKASPGDPKSHVYHWVGPFRTYRAVSKAATAKGFDPSNCEECKPE
jgi:hypothetical protein